MEQIYIFSYGSNMLYQRIRKRIASVEVMGSHKLNAYKLVFNKKSADGSAKANIQFTDMKNDMVCGVIHRISLKDKFLLDQYEYGYELKEVNKSGENFSHSLHTYIASDNKFIEEGKPYDWYLNFVISGAEENDLPSAYVQKLRGMQILKDADKLRREKNMNLISKGN